MSAFLGSAAPVGLYAGTLPVTAVYIGGTAVWSAAPVTWPTLFSDDFTGTTGAAPKAAWTKATTFPTANTNTIQSNALRISTNSTAAWSGSASVFLGDPNNPQGNATTGAPAIVSNAEYTFDYTLANLTEQYPCIMLRGRNAELWSSGNGGGQFQTGYQLVLGVAGGTVELIQGYNAGNAAAIVSFPYTFTSAAMKFRIKVDRQMLYVRIWAAASAEPSTWTYSGAVMTTESDGSIGFAISNGPAAAAKTVTIDNFVALSPALTLGTTSQAPAFDPAGFTRIFTENFDTVAPAGSGTGNFLDTYVNSVQPYAETSPTYQQRAMLSAHDGVMDIAMDGARGSAASFGTPSNYYNRLGGRFAMRAKAIGAFNNGPAVMIWPSRTSDGPWSDGEIDFPESVSGAGGTQGFQDAPWIHHHRNVVGEEAQAQDVALNVSWRDWHVYSAEWKIPAGSDPGYVKYYVDEVLVYTATTYVPSTVHRYTYQVGAYGTAGNMYIDWVTISTIN